MHLSTRGAPYRSAPIRRQFEPWLERAGWRAGVQPETGILVAVHIAWGDAVLGSVHLAGDVEFDPWRALARDAPRGHAVIVRDGRPHFVFAADPMSAVEGPGGALSFDSLLGDGMLDPVAGGGYAIAMEPGLVYRTCRGGLAVSAEIVGKPPRPAPASRARSIVTMLALCLVALLVGGGALAVAREDPQLESRSEVQNARRLAALIERAGSGSPAAIASASVRPRELFGSTWPRARERRIPGCLLVPHAYMTGCNAWVDEDVRAREDYCRAMIELFGTCESDARQWPPFADDLDESWPATYSATAAAKSWFWTGRQRTL